MFKGNNHCLSSDPYKGINAVWAERGIVCYNGGIYSDHWVFTLTAVIIL
jgi:hypothetical protein